MADDIFSVCDVPVTLKGRLDPALRDILGFQCFQLGSMAHAYQAAGVFVGEGGEPLKKRAEDEQAFMLHRMLHHYAMSGDEWRKGMSEELQKVVELAKIAIKPAKADRA